MTTPPPGATRPVLFGAVRPVLFALGFMSLGALGSLGLTAAADHGEPMGPGGHGGRGPAMLMMAIERLDLSDEQQALVDDAGDDIRDHMRQAREGMGAERDELLEAFKSGKLDRQDVHTRIDERMAAATSSMHFVTDRVMDVYESLDKDQKAELVDMLEQARERHTGMGEGGGRRGPPPELDE